jgi:predicted chitinase
MKNCYVPPAPVPGDRSDRVRQLVNRFEYKHQIFRKHVLDCLFRFKHATRDEWLENDHHTALFFATIWQTHDGVMDIDFDEEREWKDVDLIDLMATYPILAENYQLTIQDMTTEKLMNVVYDGVNGNEIGTDDGYFYRGMGLIPVVGRKDRTGYPYNGLSFEQKFEQAVIIYNKKMPNINLFAEWFGFPMKKGVVKKYLNDLFGNMSQSNITSYYETYVTMYKILSSKSK